MSERFAVLFHDWPEPHRDLFLERDGTLLSWRLPAAIGLQFPLPAIAIPSHRLHYLDYEGPVGGQRGTVTRWDRGPLKWIDVSTDSLHFELDGSQWQGAFQLLRIEGDAWQLHRYDSHPEAQA